MKDIDENVKMKEFHDKLLEMDEFIKEEAMKNSVPWFKKPKMSKDTIESLFTPMVKVHTDPETGEPTGKFPPRFGFKIVKKEGKIQCSLYDANTQDVDVNNETDNPIDINRVITKGSMLKVVLKCNGVWLANGKFGCTWRAEQVRVKVPEGGLNEFAILSASFWLHPILLKLLEMKLFNFDAFNTTCFSMINSRRLGPSSKEG